MAKQLAVPFSAALIFCLGLNYAWAQSAAPEETPAPGKYETVVTFHGKIVSVDRLDKTVTLEGPDGRKLTINVMNPYNLDAAKVGEPFVARFYQVINIRNKKPGENVQAATLASGLTTAKPGEVPGATREEQTNFLVTVDAIDQTNGTVTVRAADGCTQTVKARHPEKLKQLKVGDELVIGVYQAIAISLDKESAAGAP